MRRSDREVTDFNEIVGIIDQCDTLHLGINADGYPYVVPVSFGYDAQDGRVTLYFHGAGKGLKHELLARDARVCAEMSNCIRFCETGHSLTCEYVSAIGYGHARRVDGEQALHGLKRLNAHCGYPDYEMGDCVGITTVYAIELESLTGKRRAVKR